VFYIGRAKRRHLGPSECDELVQSSAGNQSLTQPFNVKLSNSDPNRRLQPRTPTKRSRQGVVRFVITFCIFLQKKKKKKTVLNSHFNIFNFALKLQVVWTNRGASPNSSLSQES